MKCPICDTRIKEDLTICPKCGNDLSIRHVLYSEEERKHAEEVLRNKRKAWQERKKEQNDLKSELKKSKKEKKKLAEQQQLMSEQMKEIQKKLDGQLLKSETKKDNLVSELNQSEKEKKELLEHQRSMTKQMEQMQKALEKLNSKFDSQKKKEKTRVKKEKPKKESKPSFFFKIPFTVYIGSILFGFTAYALSPPIIRMQIADHGVDIVAFVFGTAIACSVIWGITDIVSLYILKNGCDSSSGDGIYSIVIIIILTLLIWVIFDPLFHFNPFAFACIQGAIAGIICFLVIVKKYKPGIEKSID